MLIKESELPFRDFRETTKQSDVSLQIYHKNFIKKTWRYDIVLPFLTCIAAQALKTQFC